MNLFNFDKPQKSIDSESVIRQEDRKTGRQEDRKTGRQGKRMNAGLNIARWTVLTFTLLPLVVSCESSTRVDQKTGSDKVKVETTGETYTADPLTKVLPDAVQNATPFTRTGTDKCLSDAAIKNKSGDGTLSLCKKDPNSKEVQTNGSICSEDVVSVNKEDGTTRCMSDPAPKTKVK